MFPAILPAILIDGATPDLLLIGDHASNHIPSGVELGIAPILLDQHIALDIGVEPLARALCARLGCAAILGGVSRLLIDYNREIDAPGLIPTTSDGHSIPGNHALDEAEREARIARYWRRYHAIIADRIVEMPPRMLISLHSFTPKLTTSDEPRPWELGVLYNADDRAARIALPLFEAAGVKVGDNLPYSGKLLNATMNAHGEANGIPYLGLEVRQDLIDTIEGVEHWSAHLAPIIQLTAERLAGSAVRGQ